MKKLLTFIIIFCISISFGAEHSKKLKYRKGTSTTEIKLYTTTGEVGADRIAIRDGSTTVYAKLGSVTDSNRSDLRIMDGTASKAVLLSALTGDYFLVAGAMTDYSLKGVARLENNTYTPYASITFSAGYVIRKAIQSHVASVTYVAGEFTLPSKEIFGIATDGTILTMAGGVGVGTDRIFDIEIEPSTGNVYVCGNFTTTVSGVTVNRIARWNISTNTWSALGVGTVGANNSVCVMKFGPDGKLYVGGAFTMAGGIAASRFAVYNPSTNSWQGNTTWEGVDNTVRGIAFDTNNNLYICGSFLKDFPGTTTLSKFAKWSGTEWLRVSVGLPSSASPEEMTYNPHNNKLYIIEGDDAAKFKIYDITNNTFSAPVSFNGTLSCIYVQNASTMYFGGAFNGVSGKSIFGFCKHDTNKNTWEQFGPILGSARNVRDIQYIGSQ